jgi:murein DD-endopeptidase MepM/ murein hydrolase activator NlpD
MRFSFFYSLLIIVIFIASSCSPLSKGRLQDNFANTRPAERRGSMLAVYELARYRGSLDWPVRYQGVTSEFGTRGAKFHEGIDLRAPDGEEVYASHGGQVLFAGNTKSGFGKLVVLRYGPIQTIYAHNSQIIVQQGDIIERGDLIALSGSTGRVTGPHVHFEVRIRTKDGSYVAVNPRYWLAKKW